MKNNYVRYTHGSPALPTYFWKMVVRIFTVVMEFEGCLNIEFITPRGANHPYDAGLFSRVPVFTMMIPVVLFPGLVNGKQR